ncbi:MAG: serpin family protein [Prevotella sp.]|nr:serpin family protein [Prevotella sp.]MBR6903935.1 serpin family protein [Bacteroidales bacterium]
MKQTKFLIAALLLGSMLGACSSSESIEEAGEPKYVNMYQEVKPVRLTAEQTVFANDNNAFTLNFFQSLNGKMKNRSIVCSPLSITYVLSMVNDAATGTTEQELEQTLGFHKGGIQAVNDYCKNLIDNLPHVDEKVQLDIANAIFVNDKYQLKKQFQQDMANYYDAKAEALDFSSPSTLDRINGWCDEKTRGMIPTILERVEPLTVSYLLNAIYFKAEWASMFEKNETREEVFTTPDGETRVPLMHQNVYMNYLRNDQYAAVSIPYGNGQWMMTVMLPEDGKTTDDVISSLAASGWSTDFLKNPLREARRYAVDLKLPRFETAFDTDDAGGLIELLMGMGIRRAFDGNSAEIPNMCENGDLYISMMKQKAKIKVNEEGSEAAAVTIAGLNYLSAVADTQEPPKATFHANRPFVYLIHEQSSGVILFVGKFMGK